MLEKSTVSKQNSFSGEFKIFVSLTVIYFLSPKSKVCRFSISVLYVGFEVTLFPAGGQARSQKEENSKLSW